MNATRRARRLAARGGAVAVAVVVLSGSGMAGAPGAQAATPKSGGTLTVLEGSGFAGDWPEGLAPTTNVNALANQTMMNAIYGMLFEAGSGGKTIGDLASGYKLSGNAKTLTIDLRQGVTFTDGTPFDAAAVASNFRADLASSSPARPPFAVGSITTPDTSTVVLHLKTPDGAIVNQFQDSLFNWIASPTAEAKEGLKDFAVTPVGAGPFEVVSDTLDSKLVLQRNPHYLQKGRPYLSRLVFETTPSDEAALEALQSGTAQAYEYMGTPQLVKSYRAAGLTITADPGNSAKDVQVNTRIPPFNNVKAREAIYYATDAQTIDQKVYLNTCPVTESFTGPGGLFFEPKVPGYLGYDPAKARALVKQLGGLSFTLISAAQGLGASESEVLQKMYESVGMTVKLTTFSDLTSLIQDYEGKAWQLIPDSVGDWDPADGIGVGFFLHSGATYTGVDDPKVDSLISQGLASPVPATRKKLYAELASYLVQKSYLPFVCSATTWDIAAKGVEGPGLTTRIPGGDVGPEIFWEDVSVGNS